MRRHLLAGSTVVAVIVATALAVGAGPAAAATSTLYVNNTTGSNCSDTGIGTQAQPYCTITAAIAAVTAGQTVQITGTYTEHVTVNKSGTAGSPITLQGPAKLSGADAGFTIDGQHDVSIANINVVSNQNGPGFALSNSTRLTLQSVGVFPASTATAPDIQLTGVTASSSTTLVLRGNATTGITLDAGTSGVLVKSASVSVGYTASNKGIDVAGSSNTIIDSWVTGGGVAGILLDPGAANNVVANNHATSGHGNGIHNTGATGTAITNNTLQNNCATAIRVDGASSGVSVENNVALGGVLMAGCPSLTDQVAIGVYDTATTGAVVDYNTVSMANAQPPYVWGSTTPLSLAAFRAASGQGAHDIDSPYSYVNEDSANSAVPGYQPTDYYGHQREDDPNGVDTGAGPVTFADRGADERVQGPAAQLVLKTNGSPGSITADASGTTAGWMPIVSYMFNFGDGSPVVTQSTPIADHVYAKAGNYTANVRVVDTNNVVGIASDTANCVPAAASGATRLKADFNGDGKDDTALFYNYGGGHVALFTMTTQGCGTIDPPVVRWDAPDWGSGTKFVTTGDFNGDGKADIALFYDYGYGHVALFTLTADANGDGAFDSPVLRWDAPYWGSGTRFVTTGDFNGDGKTDISLLYGYGGTHVALFTLSGSSGGDGSLTGLTNRWDAPYWGSGTRLVTAGDYNGDGKADLALLYSYGGTHVALFTLTADAGGSGSVSAPTLRWDAPYWGSGTKMMTAGDYTDDNTNDLALFYSYGGNHVAVFTLPADPSGDGGFLAMTTAWDGSTWGPGTRFMTSGSYTGSGTDSLHLFYDYGTGRVAIYAVDPAIISGIAPDDLWDTPDWGTGTQAVL